MKTLHDADDILDRMLPTKYEMNVTLAIFVIATAGAFLQIGGGSWDITSHIMFLYTLTYSTLHRCWFANDNGRIGWSVVEK